MAMEAYPPQPALVWDSEKVNFGQLQKGASRDHVFTFTNTGDKPVTIEICTACDCMTLDWTTLPVAPGQCARCVQRL